MSDFIDAVQHAKTQGSADYWDLTFEQQRAICAIHALGWGKSINDVLDGINAEPILKHMAAGDATAAGEYVFSMIQRFLEFRASDSVSFIEDAYASVPEYRFNDTGE